LFDGALRLFVAEALLPLSGLVTSAVLTRRLGVAGYGRFALAATLVGTIQWVLTALLARATIRIVGESKDWQPAASAALRLYLFGGFAAGLALAVLASPLARLFGEAPLAQELRLFALDMPLFGLVQAHVNVLLGRGRFRERARARALRWTVRLALIVAFVEAGFSVTGAILGSLGASLAELIVARALVQPSLGAGQAPPLGRLWSYAMPLFLSGIGLRVMGVDLVALKALGASAMDAGFYGAALSLSMLPNLLALSVAPALLATLVRLHAEGRESEARVVTRDAARGVLLLAPFAAIGLGARVEVVRFVFGGAFAASAPLLVPLVLASLSILTVALMTAALTAVGRLRLTATLTLPMPLVAVAGYAFVVPRAGIEGAAWVTATVAVSGCLASLVAVARILGARPELATLARIAGVCASGWIASSLIPGAGVWILPKLGVLFLGCAATLLALGELPRERRGLWAALRSAA
jgi:O-antigen/teichoic acid export membrane protein